MARDNFIGGAWKPARSGATDAVLAPATGAVLDEVASSDAADVNDAVPFCASLARPVSVRPRSVPRLHGQWDASSSACRWAARFNAKEHRSRPRR